jgi:hypothetical protein
VDCSKEQVGITPMNSSRPFSPNRRLLTGVGLMLSISRIVFVRQHGRAGLDLVALLAGNSNQVRTPKPELVSLAQVVELT